MANETILIVEDDGIIAAHLQNTLTGLGYRALGPVASGEAAIAAVKVQPPDMVLMDIKLAGPLDGISAAGRIQSGADIPIVYLTCYSQDPLLQQAKVTAPYGYLVKPVGERELAATLEMALYRHSLDRRLKESEEKFRSIFNNFVDLYYQTDLQGLITNLSPSCFVLSGWKPEELIGCQVLDFYTDPKQRKTFLEKLSREGAVSGFEITLLHRDGRHIPASVSSHLIKNEQGDLRYVEGIIHDISERKQAESQREAALEALRESEKELQSLLRSMINAFVLFESVFDENGGFVSYRFIYINDAYERITGVKNEDVRGKTVHEVWPETEPEWIRRYGEVAVTGIPQTFNLFHHPTKKLYYCHVYRPWDSMQRFCVIFEDITERKRAESQKEAALEALRRTEENFRRSLDESPLGVRIVTAKGKTIYANRALLDFYDYDSIAELNQIPLRKCYTPKSYEEFKKRRKAREQGRLGPSEYEVSIVRKNGEIRHLQVFRKAILWNGERQFQTLYCDITESKQWLETLREFEKTIQGQKMLLDQQSSSVEELIERLTRSREELGASYRELKAKKDDLVRSEKLAFTGRMAAGIAHEIRNPLTNVILSIQQLKKDEKIKPEVLKYAEIVERNTKRMEYLITELLNCARPIKLNRQPCDIHLLIKDILNIHKVRLKTQRIKVVRNLTANPAILLFDKEQLGRVFLNLTANAIDAMRTGGKLTIATRSEKKKFLIKIQDNGNGISEKNLIKLFDPFFSTKKGGAGLGLSICQNIVSSHGGQIEVESAWRKGSVFSVSLPFEPQPLDRKKNMAGEP